MNAAAALSKLFPSSKSITQAIASAAASAALLTPAARADAPWNPLAAQAVNEKAFCAELAGSSPVRQYYDLKCEKGRGEDLGRNDYPKPRRRVSSRPHRGGCLFSPVACLRASL